MCQSNQIWMFNFLALVTLFFIQGHKLLSANISLPKILMAFCFNCDTKTSYFHIVRESKSVRPAHSSEMKSQHTTGSLSWCWQRLWVKEWIVVDSSRRGCTTVWFKGLLPSLTVIIIRTETVRAAVSVTLSSVNAPLLFHLLVLWFVVILGCFCFCFALCTWQQSIHHSLVSGRPWPSQVKIEGKNNPQQ